MMIKLENVTKTYTVNKRKKIALNNVCLTFPSKGFYSIVGKSGSGKSTLLNILGCLDKPTSGKMYVGEDDIYELSSKKLDYYRNTLVGFVFQNFNLIDEYTIYENIALALELQNYESDDIDIKVENILNDLNLKAIDYKYPNQISGGEKQRVAIARALIKKPKILLLDEPTGNLDKENAKILYGLLKTISKDILVVMVTHDESSAKKYSDGIIRIDNGKIVNELSVVDNDNGDHEKLIFKKSRLSISRIFRFALSNIKHRKLKFANMILLLTITFSFLFVSLHLFSYDTGYSTYRNLERNQIYSMSLIKSKDYCDGTGITKICWTETSSATRDDVTSLSNKYDNVKFNYIKAANIYISNEDDYSEEEPYYNNTITGIVYLKDMDAISDKLKYGRLPNSENEILISEYLAEMIIKFVYTEIDGIESLINNYLPIKSYGSNIIIVGILEDTHSEYSQLKKYQKDGYYRQLLTNFEVIRKSDYSLVYVKENFKFASILNSFSPSDASLKYNAKYNDINVLSPTWSNTSIPLIGNSRPLVADNEIILDIASFTQIFRIDKQTIYDHPETIDQYLNTSIFLEYTYDALNKKNKTLNFIVVGVAEHENGIYVSENNFELLYEEMIASNSWMYSGIYIDFRNTNESQIINLINNLSELGYKHNNAYSDALYVSDRAFDSLKPIFIVLIIILFIFSGLLVISTIKSTIVDRMHDIGILKSLGATNFDICKIFLFESTLVSIVILILTTALGSITNNLINKLISNSFNVPITILFTNGWIILFIIAISIALINSFCLLALKNIFSTKPIETINK